MQLTPQQIQQLSQITGIDISQFDPNEFAMGMDVEQEHQDVTNGHPVLTARIALAHLKELPDYYSRLAKMESEAKQGGEEEEEQEIPNNAPQVPRPGQPGARPPVAPRMAPGPRRPMPMRPQFQRPRILPQRKVAME